VLSIEVRATASLWHLLPVVQVEQHGGIVIVAGLEREVAARAVAGCDGSQPKRADVVAVMAATCKALANPLNESARASEMTCPP
jgi:hypothetical protein